MAFHDVQFPMPLALGAVGGPEWRTDLVTLASGQEVRNASWSKGRRRWQVGSAITDLASLQSLVAFFEARAGRLHGFRFRDPLDHASCAPGDDISFRDQSLGTGDGLTTVFQLQKTQAGVSRLILKPMAETVSIGVDGQLLETGWSVDALKGQITFETAPIAAATVTAGFEYDCAVRFDSDQIEAVIEAYGAGRIADLTLIELPASVL
ncbi:MAG: DUF2460 domain-containing protein [Pseudomonadota bacterium]